MNGHIINNTCIAVDYWKANGNYINFLTHTHGDHVVGLTSTWQWPIYCSEITATLLKNRFGVQEIFLNILPMNQGVKIQVSPSESFTVTCFDANHCLGSVMFYFEGQFGNILYTGDFRLSGDILSICLELSEKVDLLYLDNTFCSPEFNFPSREECLKKIVDIIDRHPHHDVIIGVRKLGKEKLLGQLGVTLNETITVSSEMYMLCNELFSTDVFTTISISQRPTRLSTAPVNELGERLFRCNGISPTIGIIPSGLPELHRNPNIFAVPYSDHSNYKELIQFVSALKPAKVVPIVSGKISASKVNVTDMSCFHRYLCLPRPNIARPSVIADKPFVNIYHSGYFFGQNISRTQPRRKRKIKLPPVVKKKKAKGVIYEDDELPDVQNFECHTNISECGNVTKFINERSIAEGFHDGEGNKSEYIDLIDLPEDINITDRSHEGGSKHLEYVGLTDLPDYKSMTDRSHEGGNKHLEYVDLTDLPDDKSMTDRSHEGGNKHLEYVDLTDLPDDKSMTDRSHEGGNKHLEYVDLTDLPDYKSMTDRSHEGGNKHLEYVDLTDLPDDKSMTDRSHEGGNKHLKYVDLTDLPDDKSMTDRSHEGGNKHLKYVDLTDLPDYKSMTDRSHEGGNKHLEYVDLTDLPDDRYFRQIPSVIEECVYMFPLTTTTVKE